MGRSCALTGKKVQFGHKVSHSNRKTNRTFEPNIQKVSFHSAVLGPVRLRVSTRAIRTVTKKGGIDAFLLQTNDAKLAPEALRLKHRIQRKGAAT